MLRSLAALCVFLASASALDPSTPAAALEPVVGGPGGDIEWAQRLSRRLDIHRRRIPLSAAALLADWKSDRENFQLNATTTRVLRGATASGISSLGALPRPLFGVVRRNLTLAVMQMQAEHGRTNESIAKATRLLEEGPEGDIDLLVLPELAFSGYIWDNPEHALTVAEGLDGPTYQWASAVAKQRNAHVLVGFVELDRETRRLHNSAMLVEPSGSVLHVARKTALTNTDAQWASPGSGTKSMPVVDLDGVGRIGIGICKDLSAVPQNALPGEHVLDDSFRAAAVDMIVVLAAWDSTDSSDVVHGKWMARVGKHLGTQTLLLVADQSGFEMGTPYAGSSTIMDLSGPNKLAEFSEVAEGVLVHQVLNYPIRALAAAAAA